MYGDLVHISVLQQNELSTFLRLPIRIFIVRYGKLMFSINLTINVFFNRDFHFTSYTRNNQCN